MVGGGNSGVQIAEELARGGRKVHLTERTRIRHIGQRIAHRDLFWWLSVTGAIHAPATSRIGRRLQADAVIGAPRARLVQAGIRFHPGVSAAQGRTVSFAEGSTLTPEAVLWATGYRHEDRWITVPGALGSSRALITDQGHTSVPGLYTLGRPWHRNRGSALLGFVGADARGLITELTAHNSTMIPPSP